MPVGSNVVSSLSTSKLLKDALLSKLLEQLMFESWNFDPMMLSALVMRRNLMSFGDTSLQMQAFSVLKSSASIFVKLQLVVHCFDQLPYPSESNVSRPKLKENQ